MAARSASGPLTGIRVLELGGKGPTPFAGMMLADMGADVTVIDRLGADRERDGADIMARGKTRVRADLRDPAVRDALLAAMPQIDILIEGFRPGAAERLGLGPDDVSALNPRLVYGRMTGYGQGTSWSGVAGHDIDFLAISSALAHIGPADHPVPPLNLVGDFGGGAMFLVTGVLAALVDASRSGRGQVVDAAMSDGSALLMASVYGLRSAGLWTDARADNMTDGGAPYYSCYRTADGEWIAIGALEPTHWDAVLRVCGIDATGLPPRDERAGWPAMRERLTEVFASRDRAAWERAFDGVDASFAPVLTMADAWEHPFHRERETFPVIDDVRQPAPAPRFGRTPSAVADKGSPAASAVFARLGASDDVVADLTERGVIR